VLTHQPTPWPICCTLAECGEDDQLRRLSCEQQPERTGGRSGSYLELQQRRSFRSWTNKSSPWRLDNAWEVCDNGHVLQFCWLPLTRAHDVFLGISDANCSWWFCELTSVRCLSDEQSVTEICGYLAHYPGSEPDHQLCRFYQQHAQCLGDRLSTVPVSSILQISFFKPPNDHCFSGNIDIKRLAPYCLICHNNFACLQLKTALLLNFKYPSLVNIDVNVMSRFSKNI